MKWCSLLSVSMVAALLPLAFADDAVGAPAASPAAVQQKECVALVREMMQTMDEVSSLLNAVMDKAGADAAAVRLPALLEKLVRIVEQGRKLESPPAIDGNAELEALEEAHEASQERMQEAFVRVLEAECYGSEALMEQVEVLF